MKFGTFRKFGALNSSPVFDAFEQSIKRKGWTVSINDEDADIAVIWSVLWNGRMTGNKKIYEKFRKKDKPVIVLEVGCLDRGNLWKVGLNGINGSGFFGSLNNGPERRKKLNINLSAWRGLDDPFKDESKIILCGQHPNSEQWHNMPNMNIWFDNTITEIRKYTNRKIIVRPHPRASIQVPGNRFKKVVIDLPRAVPGTYDSFDFTKALSNTWAVINWNSNPATLAALNGVPIFVGPDSYAAPVGNLDLSKIEDPFMPDREQWANDLAYTEWTVEEIASGEPLDRLSSKIIV